MADLLDPRLAVEIGRILARHPDAAGASAMLDVLSKVAPTAGSRITDLSGRAQQATLLQRIGAAANYVIRGVTPETWFGPGQPIGPMAPKPEQGAYGRRFDYSVAQNIQFQPKTEQGAGVPFYVMRSLRDSYDLLALCVETRKDQAAGFEWEVIPKAKNADQKQFKDQIKKASEFMERPSREDDWPDFLRQIVDDCLVCDGVALYPQMTRGGGLYSLIPIDVASIKLLVDEQGMRPEPPSPAYQQVMKGVPAVDYTADQLFYWRRNRRTNRVYGFSPVEQVIVTTNIALKRQQYQLEYYTEGNIPDSLLGVPETWTPDQITEFQTQFDSWLGGNTGARRKARFIPGDVKALLTLKDTQVTLTDQADEWFARVVCFALSVAPIALLKMVNRAAGAQIAESAKEEGNVPFLTWVATKLTQIINGPLGCPDVKFAFKFDVEIDPNIKSQIQNNDVKDGIRSIDEVRAEKGLQPRGMDDLIVYTPQGPVPLKETVERAREDAVNPPPPPPAFGGAPGAAAPGQPGADDAGKTPPPGGKPKAKQPPVNVEKRDGDVHVTVGSPIIEVHTPPVRVGGVEVNADLRPERRLGEALNKSDERPKVRKARARRDEATGDLLAEFWDEDSKLQRRVNVERPQP